MGRDNCPTTLQTIRQGLVGVEPLGGADCNLWDRPTEGWNYKQNWQRTAPLTETLSCHLRCLSELLDGEKVKTEFERRRFPLRAAVKEWAAKRRSRIPPPVWVKLLNSTIRKRHLWDSPQARHSWSTLFGTWVSNSVWCKTKAAFQKENIPPTCGGGGGGGGVMVWGCFSSVNKWNHCFLII